MSQLVPKIDYILALFRLLASSTSQKCLYF